MNKEASGNSQNKDIHKLSLNIPVNELNHAKLHADEDNATFTDYTRTALKREGFLRDYSREGGQVIVTFPDDPTRPEIVFMDLEFIRRNSSK